MTEIVKKVLWWGIELMASNYKLKQPKHFNHYTNQTYTSDYPQAL